ncbi:MAG: hypothetical protein M3P26_07480 [Gemmatimonadota bacterium]|nr:hypothetical protein [Gemmatimonadota bacterium]
MASSHAAFLGLLDQGVVAHGEAIGDWAASDSSDLDDLIERRGEFLDGSSGYDTERLRADARNDLELLVAFAEEAERVTPDTDPKLVKLKEALAEIAAEAATEMIGPQDERNKRKVLLFSYFTDTVDWIREYLLVEVARDPRLAVYRDRVVTVTGDEGNRAAAMFGFAPETTEAPPNRAEDRFDIIVSTDVLAEGVNLQQARHVMNYDLPWNPMRLVQRHGRIDRIGSPHAKVFVHCFFPDKQLDTLLGLEQRLHRKIKQAAAAVGVSSEILPGSRVTDVIFGDTRVEIERLRHGEPSLFVDAGEMNAYSGEEYRQELRAGFENPETEEQVLAMPWGSGSGLARVGGESGYVFCARVGDHSSPQFRFVRAEPAEEAESVVADTLTCLTYANAAPETARVLDEDTHQVAYQAWARARADIYESWMRGADPRFLQPVVPKAMRDAAELLRNHPPPYLTHDELRDLIDAVEAPYGPKVLGLIRRAIRSSTDGREQAEAVAATVKDLGLAPAEAPRPLPVIVMDDIHLVCWMAVVGIGDQATPR